MVLVWRRYGGFGRAFLSERYPCTIISIIELKGSPFVDAEFCLMKAHPVHRMLCNIVTLKITRHVLICHCSRSRVESRSEA